VDKTGKREVGVKPSPWEVGKKGEKKGVSVQQQKVVVRTGDVVVLWIWPKISKGGGGERKGGLAGLLILCFFNLPKGEWEGGYNAFSIDYPPQIPEKRKKREGRDNTPLPPSTFLRPTRTDGRGEEKKDAINFPSMRRHPRRKRRGQKKRGKKKKKSEREDATRPSVPPPLSNVSLWLKH